MKQMKLSGRWTHAERETLLVGKLGFGDVSKWARATTQAQRPEVGRVEHRFQPVRSLGSIKPFVAGRRVHNPDVVCLPGQSKDEGVTKAIKACDKSAKAFDHKVKLGNAFANVYACLGKSVVGTVKEYA